MDLSDLLAEVEGIGPDRFTPSRKAIEVGAAPPPADELSAVSSNTDEATTGAAPPSVTAPVTEAGVGAAASRPIAPAPTTLGSLEMIADVELELTVELGQSRLPLKHLLQIAPGDAFLLDRHPDDPLLIYANNHPIARGEVLVVDGTLAVKIVELLVTDATG